VIQSLLMKLAVLIPCFNEEDSLPAVLKTIPKKIRGITKIDVIIVDDASTDRTVAVAKKHGIRHIVVHRANAGLATSFADGVEKALTLGADIIVNTDGDNQYPQQDIARLIQPILEGKADMVIADRQTDTIAHFSPTKKFLQRLGSSGIRFITGTTVPDAVCGFRAMTRDAAQKLNIFTKYTYTIETIIQAGKKNLRIESIPITTNPKFRESRLVKSYASFMRKSLSTIVRILALYEPLKVFALIGFVIALPGLSYTTRFVYFYLSGADGGGQGHIQSLILGAILILVGFQIAVIGLVADLIAMNRKLDEEILYRLKNSHLSNTLK
jgi:glycosyltransferase involved in cell wall biosynthesis